MISPRKKLNQMGLAQKIRNFLLTMTQEKQEVQSRQNLCQNGPVLDKNLNFSTAKISKDKRTEKEEGHFQFQIGQSIKNTYQIQSLLGEG